MTKTKRKPTKPTKFKTRNLFASCKVDSKNRVVVTIFDRGHWLEEGCTIPTNAELEQLTDWVKRVRAYARARK